MGRIWVSDSLDDLNIAHVRLLECAAEQGPVHLVLWSDEAIVSVTGCQPKFPLPERRYAAQAIRYIEEVHIIEGPLDPQALIAGMAPGDIWLTADSEHADAGRDACANAGISCVVLDAEQIASLPPVTTPIHRPHADCKTVVVTGCFDWFHSGHIRFFEEVCEYGDLYVIVGHDRNVRKLKGAGHPMFNEHQRWYMVQAIRYVTAAMISSGHGWMDAEPEIEKIQPDLYIVNEDGDRPEKRHFCAERGIEYIVLKRLPKQGLPRRESRRLRGF